MTTAPRRPRAWQRLGVLLAVLLVTAAVALTTGSSAIFTSASGNGLSTVSAGDWVPPTVSLTNPGSAVSGDVTLTAQAADVGGSGVSQVVFEGRAAGASTWTTLCTDGTEPYSCTWKTASVPDGTYALRAVATDLVGLKKASEPVQTLVANSVRVELGVPADFLSGSATFRIDVYNRPNVTVHVQYRATGTSRWIEACSALSLLGPASCTWDTRGVTSGDYELRAGAGLVAPSYSEIVEVTVDNTAPTVTLDNPGTPLRGTVTLSAVADDTHSGVAEVRFQHLRSGTTTWTTGCTATEDPYTCDLDTTSLADGSYSFRAVAVDAAGNPTTSTVISSRQVDNTVSAVSLRNPGTYLSGSVTLRADASSTAGVTRVAVQWAPRGGSAWTDVCTVATTPYACVWDTTVMATGSYDLRAVLTDGAGKTTTSAVLTDRRIDNSPLRALDVQTENGGVVAGRLDVGDLVTFTYSRTVQPATLRTGWTGATPLAVTVRLRDGKAVGTGNNADVVDVMVGNQVLPLGSVNLRSDYIQPNRTATFAGTLTMSTEVVAGLDRSVITMTVGSPINNNGLRTASAPNAMVWTPSTSVLDLQGAPCAATPAVESGPADREF